MPFLQKVFVWHKLLGFYLDARSPSHSNDLAGDTNSTPLMVL